MGFCLYIFSYLSAVRYSIPNLVRPLKNSVNKNRHADHAVVYLFCKFAERFPPDRASIKVFLRLRNI